MSSLNQKILQAYNQEIKNCQNLKKHFHSTL